MVVEEESGGGGRGGGRGEWWWWRWCMQAVPIFASLCKDWNRLHAIQNLLDTDESYNVVPWYQVGKQRQPRKGCTELPCGSASSWLQREREKETKEAEEAGGTIVDCPPRPLLPL